MIHSIEIKLCEPTETRYIRNITCDVCGRAESQTTTDGANVFPGWEFREGPNHSPWHTCPDCSMRP